MSEQLEYNKYSIKCGSCEEVFLVLIDPNVIETPKFCPFCGDVNISGFEDD